MSHGFVFRPGTNDEIMFHHIQEVDEYHLPATFSARDIVIDIGVHIGAFSYKVLRRGVGRVYGFEADPANFACAVRNLQGFGNRVQLRHAAVWRSDRPVATLNFTRSHDPANTGGGNTLWEEGAIEVPAIAFDNVLHEITQGGKQRIRLLKIDCEGAEFPILMTSRRLHLIDEIAGEFHEHGGQLNSAPVPQRARIPGYDQLTIIELTDALQRAGFRVTSHRHEGSHLGLFHAVNTRTSIAQPKFLNVKDRLRSAWRLLKTGRSSAA
jgi:FkbM family methyltransferase